MDIKHTVQDNYLNETDYKGLKKAIMLETNFPWYFTEKVAGMNDQREFYFYWAHIFFTQHGGVTSPFLNILSPILKKLKLKALIRVKANLYSNQGKIVEHENHVDFPFKHKTALFSLNTCNGFTVLAHNTKIKSVGNRMLFFDASKPHHSSTCTDENVRVNITFNYF